MFQKEQPIGIFDAGVGGLSVLRQIYRLLPNENTIYFSDSDHRPYTKNPDDLIKKYSLEIIDFLVKKNSKVIVIACNTATSLILNEAQNSFKLPIIGVIEPGVIAAIRETKNNSIEIMGSRVTARKKIHRKLIQKINPHIKVYELACLPDLANIVEEGLNIPFPDIQKKIDNYLKPSIKKGFDTLILSCTHFPFLIDFIMKALPEDIKIIDPAIETVVQLKNILQKNNLISGYNKKIYHYFYTSGNPIKLKNSVWKLLSVKGEEVYKVSL